MVAGKILQIGEEAVQSQLRQQLERDLIHPNENQKRLLSSALLWGDDEALELFEAYSTIPQYYPTHDEINLLNCWGDEIIRYMVKGTVLVDLGCGSVHKVKPLLDAIERAQIQTHYYALDLSQASLERQIDRLQAADYKHVTCSGLWGTFEDVKHWTRIFPTPPSSIWYLSFGSILGNDEFEIAVRDLQDWSQVLRPQDRILIGIDGCQDERKVLESYNTPIPSKPSMVRHALDISNQVLGSCWYLPDDWDVEGVSRTDDKLAVCVYHWVIRARREVVCDQLQMRILPGEEIWTKQWFKWGPSGMARQFQSSGLELVNQWKSPTGPFYQYLVRPGE